MKIMFAGSPQCTRWLVPLVSAVLALVTSSTCTALAMKNTNAYVANRDSNTVSVIDTRSNTVFATIAGFNRPVGIAVAPDGGSVYVCNSAENTVAVINAATNAIASKIEVGKTPGGVAISSDATRVYVLNNGSTTVSVIDNATKTVVATVNFPSSASRLARIVVAPNGQHVYVSQFENNVYVIDTLTNTVVDTIFVNGFPFGMAVTRDSRLVYVANSVIRHVEIITAANDSVSDGVFVEGGPTELALTPNGQHLYVSTLDNTVAVIDTSTATVTATIPLTVPATPRMPAVTTNGREVYVPNDFANAVSVIDTSHNTIKAVIPVDRNPQTMATQPRPIPGGQER